MLSHSTNARYPAFSQRANDRYLTSDANKDQSTLEVQLWSSQEPPLKAGSSYSISVFQDLKPPGASDTPRLDLPDKALKVSGSRFKLADQNDIHSVYPPPGHSEHSATLAHVVFRHPTTPWQRDLGTAPGTSNRLPWLGVLSFTEKELVLDTETAKSAGLVKDGEKLSAYGAVSTTAGDLASNNFVATSLKSSDGDAAAKVDALLLERDFFRTLFTGYGADDKPDLAGAVGASRFALMAHVRQMHGGFMASTDTEAAKPRFSVVVSPRTGPVGEAKPTRVITHLFSLEGLSDMDLATKKDAKYVALVSLFSWDWMCIPPEHVDFVDIMCVLGQNVKPLRIYDDDATKKASDEGKGAAKQTDGPPSWLSSTLKAGYTVKPRTLGTGEQTYAMFRGPLLPTRPVRDMIKPFETHWQALELAEKTTGLSDITYSAAWNLGRVLAMADGIFTASLLRLREKAHVAAMQQVTTSALGKFALNKTAFFAGVEKSLESLARAHDVGKLADRGAQARWLRTAEEQEQLPVQRLSKAGYDYGKYMDAVSQVMSAYFSAKDADTDALSLRAWALDKFYLAGVPLHYLVPDPDMLPRESIRTFCVDARWVDALVDGALSLANHGAQDDDAIRREMKSCINSYITESQKVPDSSSQGSILQLPKWGFLLRSVAVTAFPDLKVEAHLPDKTAVGIREVLYMQVLADDILICLFDRMPGQDGFDSITISQPPHQQCFVLGQEFNGDSFQTAFRPIPLAPETLISESAVLSKQWKKDPDRKVEIYDWESRLLRPERMLKHYQDEMRNSSEKDRIFRLDQKDEKDQALSSVLASQLSSPVLHLTLPIGKNPPNPDKDDRPREPLYVKPRPSEEKQQEKRLGKRMGSDKAPSSHRPDPGFAALPRALQRQLPVAAVSTVKNGQPLGGSNSEKDVLEVMQYPDAMFTSEGVQAACFPIYDPPGSAGASGAIYALDRPFDLVFSLRFLQPGASSDQRDLPAALEVRIPVVLGSGANDLGSTSQSKAMLVVPGTAAAPVLPRVEKLNPNFLCSFSARLVIGSLYPADPPPSEKAALHPLKAPSVLLVVTLTPRLALATKSDQWIDCSFILRRVTTVNPPEKADDSLQVQYDVGRAEVWRAGTSRMPPCVQPKNASIRRATTLSILDDGTYYDVEKQEMHLKFSSSAALSDLQELVMLTKPPPGGIESTIVLEGKLHNSTTDEFSISMQREQVPRSFRLLVRSKAGGDKRFRMGPETALSVLSILPLIPKSVEIKFHWSDSLHASWAPFPPDTLAPVRWLYRFTPLAANGVDAAQGAEPLEFDGRSGQALLPKDKLEPFRLENNSFLWIQCQVVAVDQPNIRGLLWSSKTRFSLLRVKPRDQQFDVSSLETVERSSLVELSGGPSEGFDLFYVHGVQQIHAIRFRRDSNSFVKKVIDQNWGRASGAISAYWTQGENSIEVCWVADNGCINSMTRSGDPNTAEWHPSTTVGLYGRTNTASISSGGALATISGTVENVPLTWVWLLDPQGGIRGFYRVLNFQWFDGNNWNNGQPLGNSADIDAGPRRPSQLQAWYYSNPGSPAIVEGAEDCGNVVWIKRDGSVWIIELVSIAKPTVHWKLFEMAISDDTAPGVRASAECGFAIYHRKCAAGGGTASLKVFAFWVSLDGRVFGAYAVAGLGVSAYPWSRFLVAGPGSAHVGTRLRAIDTGDGDEIVLVWFDPAGVLQAGVWRDKGSTDMTDWSLSAFSPEIRTAPGGPLEICVSAVPSSGRRDLFWVDADTVNHENRLRSLSVDM